MYAHTSCVHTLLTCIIKIQIPTLIDAYPLKQILLGSAKVGPGRIRVLAGQAPPSQKATTSVDALAAGFLAFAFDI